MIEPGQGSKKSFHLAGVIPVAGQPLDFNCPWNDSLMPIAPDYLAIENSVYECAAAGCETIWIVCHKEMQPLIRHRVGEWVLDPRTSPYIKSKFVKHASEHAKEVAIYYVPVHPKDRDRRDCLAWSVLYGAVKAFHVSSLISKWTVPDMYYVSFPYGVYNLRDIEANREIFSTPKRFFARANGKTVADGEYLPFTFNAEDFVNFRREVRAQETGVWESGGVWNEEEKRFEGTKLNPEDRYSGRFLSLTDVFKGAKIEDGNVVDLSWYYNIGDWEGYCQYLGSEERKTIKRPSYYLAYHEFNRIGEDSAEDEDEEE